MLLLNLDWRLVIDRVFYLFRVIKMARIILILGTLLDAIVENIKN